MNSISMGESCGRCPDEEHQLPILLIVAAPSRHPGEANSILDDVEQLAVAEGLGRFAPHVRRGRIESSIDHVLPLPLFAWQVAQ